MGANHHEASASAGGAIDATAKEALLLIRLAGITEAQKRARLALFVAALASVAIFAAEWNSYFSWDRQWAERLREPNPWGQHRLLEQQIKSWVDTNGVNLSLVGLRVSVSDAAVLGSLVLFVAAFYVCITAKRENSEIGAVLREMLVESDHTRKRVLAHIRATAVFNVEADHEGPIDDLLRCNIKSKAKIVGTAPAFLTYLPLLAVLAVVLTDIYFAVAYISPWSGYDLPAFSHLSSQYQVQLVAMDTFAVIFGAITLRYCRIARQYQLATQNIIGQFGKEPLTSTKHEAEITA